VTASGKFLASKSLIKTEVIKLSDKLSFEFKVNG